VKSPIVASAIEGGRVPKLAWVKRSLIFALVGVTSGAAVHTLAGGSLPGLTGLIPAIVFSTLIALVFLRKRTLFGIVSSVLVGQWVFHHTVNLAVPVTNTHDHAAVPAIEWDQASVAMAGGHTGAAIVTAIAVLWAEALWALAGSVVDSVSRLTILRRLQTLPVMPMVPVSRSWGISNPWRVKLIFVGSEQTSRGPPPLSGV